MTDQTFPFPGSSINGPSATYDQLRLTDPICRVPTRGGVDAWVVSNYEHVRSLLADPRLSRAMAAGDNAPRIGGSMHSLPEMIISLDGAEHSRLRKLVAGSFTMKKIRQMRPEVTQITEELLDDIEAHGPPADLVEDFAVPLPLVVIGRMLGVPSEDILSFKGWARDFATVDESAGGEQSLQGLAKLHEYIAHLVAEKRTNPSDDMLSELIMARDEGGRLSEQELITFGFTLIGAGFDTTANQLANSILAALTYGKPAWTTMVEDPQSVTTVVEELLRHVNLFATDTSGFPRVASERIEIAGVTIEPGDAVVLALASANRDEAVFDNPTELNPRRDTNPHISFGHGLHMCLGKHLARMELEIAFAALTRRLPDLRLAQPIPAEGWMRGEINHTLISLPVTWP
ncbi:cytochrome P450 [Enemella evansiae]|uniref:cytochrome P450 n=1 Tax=Enemella evansiae TaxID=2016499 RepID=UPI000B972FC9|nr:cytochrome P450 [Enemella evansiae]OYO15487.1 cytochrome P450 [Enemella evansiae]